MTCEINQSDVLRLILQFLKETNFTLSFKTLQEETKISLNTLENKDSLASDIKQGRWDQVLKTTKSFRLPSFKQMALHEQILYELLELSEKDLALQIFNNHIPRQVKDEFPEKSHFLETLIQKGTFNFKEIGTTREKLRNSLADLITEEVISVPSSRLLILLGQALKYQEMTGELKPNISLNIFTNKIPEVQDKYVELPTKITKKLIFPSNARINALDFSPNGQNLVLGAADGIIEVWNPLEGKIRKDLTYQAEEAFMLHETGITSLKVSNDNELLASGDKDGVIKIWRLVSGKCLRKIATASGIVSFLSFRKESSHLIVGSPDNIRVFGLKSGRVLKEFRGGISGLVNEVLIKEDKLCSGSKDGFVRLFDWTSCECVMSFRMNEGVEQEVTNILEAGANLVVCNRRTLALISWSGVILKKFDIEKKDVISACLSLKAMDETKGYVYAVTTDNVLICLNYNSGVVEASLKFGEKGEMDVIGIKQHPLRNLIILWSMNGVILYLAAN